MIIESTNIFCLHFRQTWHTDCLVLFKSLLPLHRRERAGGEGGYTGEEKTTFYETINIGRG